MEKSRSRLCSRVFNRRPALFFLITILSSAIFIVGCKNQIKKRPLGFAKLGVISAYRDVPVREIYEYAVLVRQDERGLYAMSTLCSHDLRRLKVKKNESGPILFCDVCNSEFDGSGKVLKEPAISPLPYFNLFLGEGLAGGPKDTLYARIGVEVNETWRLSFPKEYSLAPK